MQAPSAFMWSALHIFRLHLSSKYFIAIFIGSVWQISMEKNFWYFEGKYRIHFTTEPFTAPPPVSSRILFFRFSSLKIEPIYRQCLLLIHIHVVFK
jgi:hypothetical protein